MAYRRSHAARLLRVSADRLRYWERTDLIEPSARVDQRPAFGFGDLATAKRLVALLREGVSLGRIRRSTRAVKRLVPEVEQPLDVLRTWVPGSQRVVLRVENALMEPNGQTVIDFSGSGAASVPSAVTQLHGPAMGAPLTDPNEALEWFERGCALDSNPKTHAEAIEAYRKSLAADPQFADAYCNLGAIYYNQRRRDAATDAFERALAIDPDHLEANLNLANLLEDANRNAAALRHYKIAMRNDPLHPDVQLNLALLYEKLGLGGKARGHWRRYLQVDPSGTWAEIARNRLEPGSP